VVARRKSEKKLRHAPQAPPKVLGFDRALLFTVLRFSAYFAVMVTISLVILPPAFKESIQLATAHVAAALISLAGIPVARDGILLRLPSVILQIDSACTAVTVLQVYIALILAQQATALQRMVGFGAGTVAILIANQLRILATALVAERAPLLLGALHDYLFQVSMVVVVLGVWAAWLQWVSAQSTGES